MIRRLLPPAAFLALVALSGCGGGASPSASHPVSRHLSTPRPTTVAIINPVPTQPPPTPFPPSPPTPHPTTAPRPTAPPATATPRPAPTVPPVKPTAAPVAPQPPHVVSASLRPTAVPAGGALRASVMTAGAVQRVEVYLGSGAPAAPTPLTYVLAEVAPGSWEGTGSAPSLGGEYHFAVGLFDRAGRRSVADNDAWNIEVSAQPTAAPVTGQALPLPPDIPLAPPFSYGNPIAAQFNANGTTVNGSEVISTSRPDVAPALVSQFYSLHLPRAGWTVAPSTLPPPGATSFSIYATSPGAGGTRVCIIQYSSSTIYIFYGTIPG